MSKDCRDVRVSDWDYQCMQRALGLARQAAEHGEVPVGAVLEYRGEIIGEGRNSPIKSCDPSAHAEINALRSAAKNQRNYRLPGTTLYVTIEPCTMCAGALVHARVERVVFGALEPRAGALVSNKSLLDAGCFNHQLQCSGGVLADEASALMQTFFRQKRAAQKALKRQARGEDS